MRKCVNCGRVWKEEELEKPFLNCAYCGDNTIEVKETASKKKKEKIDMDLNNDGKVDEKDMSIAGKVLSSARKNKKNKKKK